MSLEYYLLVRRNYKCIIDNLKSAIEQFDDIFYLTSELDIDDGDEILSIYNPHLHSETIKSKLKCVEHLSKLCEQKILRLCKHEFVKDTIDICPERSQNITYCSICEYNVCV